jgi:hypothetical protein
MSILMMARTGYDGFFCSSCYGFLFMPSVEVDSVFVLSTREVNMNLIFGNNGTKYGLENRALR